MEIKKNCCSYGLSCTIDLNNKIILKKYTENKKFNALIEDYLSSRVNSLEKLFERILFKQNGDIEASIEKFNKKYTPLNEIEEQYIRSRYYICSDKNN